MFLKQTALPLAWSDDTVTQMWTHTSLRRWDLVTDPMWFWSLLVMDTFFFGRRQHWTRSFCCNSRDSCCSCSYITESVNYRLPVILLELSLKKVEKNKLDKTQFVLGWSNNMTVLLKAVVLCFLTLCFAITELKMLSQFLWSNMRRSSRVNDCGCCSSGEVEVWQVRCSNSTGSQWWKRKGKTEILMPTLIQNMKNCSLAA